MKRPILTDAQLIESNWSMFSGPDETEIRCQTTRVVSVRKIQRCMCPACSCEPEEHVISPGKRAVCDRAIADGRWGACYVCVPCLTAWWNHIRYGDKYGECTGRDGGRG